jgi:hypothetical protein
MAVVRIEALRALKARIETAIPELAGKVKVSQAPAGEEQTYPTLTIIPGTWKFDPHGEAEFATIGDPADGNVVFNVGAHSAPVQLRIVATTIGERWTLEQKVVDLFLGQELRAGVVIVPVTSCPELSTFIAAFEYDSDQWVDVGAFDRKLESAIVVNGVMPALVARTEVYEIDELVLGLTYDFDTAFTTDTMVPPNVELVLINQDGTIQPWSPP